MAERRRDAVRRAYESMGIDRHTLAHSVGLTPSTITNVMAGAPLSRVKAALIGQIIGWTADEVLAGERKLDREAQRRSEHVAPETLPPARPAQEPTHPPTRPDSDSVHRGAA